MLQPDEWLTFQPLHYAVVKIPVEAHISGPIQISEFSRPGDPASKAKIAQNVRIPVPGCRPTFPGPARIRWHLSNCTGIHLVAKPNGQLL